MTRRVLIHQRVTDDLIEHVTYIAKDKIDPADRLLQAAQKLFDDLARFPNLGRRWKTDAKHLQDVRIVPIPGFSNYLVFYRTTARGVAILTVLHGSRDLTALIRLIDRKPLD